MSHRNPDDAPKADSTHFYKCDACEHIHIALVDERGRFLATAVVSRDMLESMFKCIDGELPPDVRVQ